MLKKFSRMDIVVKYFQSPGDYTNHFYPPADPIDITDAEEALEITFPDDYKKFLLYSNGFEGFINGFYLRLVPVGFVYESTMDYCSEFYPWAIYLGTNAGGEMVVLDTRMHPIQFGMLPYLGSAFDRQLPR
ncbi:MAG: SMI1/KNR4 family protein [Chitinophagaceae bacterium]|nr:MAG: SMI1/KNR4 family protein [Chitinophagaceae bacterium]